MQEISGTHAVTWQLIQPNITAVSKFNDDSVFFRFYRLYWEKLSLPWITPFICHETQGIKLITETVAVTGVQKRYNQILIFYIIIKNYINNQCRGSINVGRIKHFFTSNSFSLAELGSSISYKVNIFSGHAQKLLSTSSSCLGFLGYILYLFCDIHGTKVSKSPVQMSFCQIKHFGYGNTV